MKNNYTMTKDNITAIVEWELIDGKFSASGSIKENRQFIAAGQCLDTIKEYFPDDTLFNSIFEVWKEWHLNDLTAGSPNQERFLKDYKESGNDYNYSDACVLLESAGLLVDNDYIHNGKPYKYGSAWLTRIIPDDVIRTINRLSLIHI